MTGASGDGTARSTAPNNELSIINCTPFSNRADPKLSTEEVNAQLVETSTVMEEMSTHEVDENSSLRINKTDYCKCGHCKPMTSVEESVCCKERKIGVHIMGGMGIQFICAIH